MSMHVFGLTGGIATGKSTVSTMFRELGVKVVDADQLAREIVEPGQPALAQIAAKFQGVIDSDGRLNREKLGEQIFNDREKRATLNAITHPTIQQRVQALIAEFETAGIPRMIYDVPLLFENNLQKGMNGVVLVIAPFEVQKARLMARNGLSESQALSRINAQMPLEEKARLATWVIDNSGTLDVTQAQVEAVLTKMKAM